MHGVNTVLTVLVVIAFWALLLTWAVPWVRGQLARRRARDRNDPDGPNDSFSRRP